MLVIFDIQRLMIFFHWNDSFVPKSSPLRDRNKTASHSGLHLQVNDFQNGGYMRNAVRIMLFD
jgi:hypothetical protein